MINLNATEARLNEIAKATLEVKKNILDEDDPFLVAILNKLQPVLILIDELTLISTTLLSDVRKMHAAPGPCPTKEDVLQGLKFRFWKLKVESRNDVLINVGLLSTFEGRSFVLPQTFESNLLDRLVEENKLEDLQLAIGQEERKAKPCPTCKDTGSVNHVAGMPAFVSCCPDCHGEGGAK